MRNLIPGLRAAAAALCLALATLSLAPSPAEAQLRVRVSDGVREAVPVALPPILGPEQPLAEDILRIVERNLATSGLIRVVPREAHLERPDSLDAVPRYQNWRAIDVQHKLVARIDRAGNNVTLLFRLWDIFGERQSVGKSFTFDPRDFRRAAHRLSDEIYTAITGEGPYFDSRIAFVDEQGDRTARVKRIAIMDQDGANVRHLTDAREFVLTPRMSPDGRHIAFLSWRTGRPSAFLMEVGSGRAVRLGEFTGMSFSPSFHPNGREIALSMERNGNTDLYVMDMSGRVLRQLTTHPAIETSPSYSPDGSQIVFTSDREGSPQLYVMSANGGPMQRITSGRGGYSSPEWSPRGDLIAFSRQQGGQFSIGVVRPDGTGERILHSDYMLDSPTWSPNGRVLLFSQEGRGAAATSTLWSIDVTGQNLRRVPTPGGASDPSWSRLRE